MPRGFSAGGRAACNLTGALAGVAAATPTLIPGERLHCLIAARAGDTNLKLEKDFVRKEFDGCWRQGDGSSPGYGRRGGGDPVLVPLTTASPRQYHRGRAIFMVLGRS